MYIKYGPSGHLDKRLPQSAKVSCFKKFGQEQITQESRGQIIYWSEHIVSSNLWMCAMFHEHIFKYKWVTAWTQSVMEPHSDREMFLHFWQGLVGIFPWSKKLRCNTTLCQKIIMNVWIIMNYRYTKIFSQFFLKFLTTRRQFFFLFFYGRKSKIFTLL